MSAAEILDACAEGRMPPPIALMHLIGAAATEESFAQQIAQARDSASPRLIALCALAARNPACWRLTHDMLATVTHDGAASVEQLAAMFDDAVALSPAASVALYSMGDEAELDAATQEIVDLMAEAHLLGEDRDVLDLGCGIGRFVRALAPRVRHVAGLDISAKMIGEAQRRCANLANVSLAVTSGRDLAQIGDASLDVILAADVFPYLVQVDLALVATHLREAARVLRGGGALLILNFSYRGDLAQDRRDLDATLAGGPLHAAALPAPRMAHWDAAPFLVRKHD